MAELLAINYGQVCSMFMLNPVR